MASILGPLPCGGCDCPNHFFLHDTSPSFDSTSAKSDLAHLKFSNHAPTEKEADALRDMIFSSENRMDLIDEEGSVLAEVILDMKRWIVTSEQRMLALRQEQLRLEAETHIWKSLLSPIQHVPDEIWVRIFRHTVEPPKSLRASWYPRAGTFSNRSWDFKPTEDFLWAIEGVCSKWRSILLNSPSLWSNIEIFITNSNFGVNANNYVRKLGRQMDRSGNHPLTITISTPNVPAFASIGVIPSQLVMLLHSFSSRIQYLRFNLPSRQLQSVPSLRLSLPSLHTLFLLSTDGNGIARRSDSFAFCPSLRNFACVDIIDPSAFSLPWHQINDYMCRYFRIRHSEASIHIRMLERLVNLKTCVLDCHSRFPAPFSHDVALPSICRNYRSLHLWPNARGDGDVTVMPQIMNRLTLPQLRKLDVVCPSLLEELDTFSAIRGLIHRSIPPLTHLCFMRGHIDSDDLLHIIQITPTLEELKLSQLNKNAITPEIIQALTWNHPSGNMNVPRLHTIRMSNAEQVGLPSLVNMIRSRWILEEGRSDVSRLRSVEIIGDSRCLGYYTAIKALSTFADLGQWISDGLRCEVYKTFIAYDN
ncbi:hypothetical protein EV421DRAFT_1867979 [Armillaria borealis]|uniref:F-box domain-containing protein n=1 Tax=Armillaria borealis TaxID=47425 RepID=A0AA39ICH8_9AGAR|nr:hypothetical protein EV421DRAFT_1867979 [Armillaria borealis]